MSDARPVKKRPSRNPNGRRGKPPELRLPEIARFRCSIVEYDDLCRQAIKRGLSLSEYLRCRLSLGTQELVANLTFPRAI